MPGERRGGRQLNVLTAKQARFVEEYVVDLNASAAALRAGYKNSDVGRQLLTKAHVQQEIARRRQQLSEATGITTEWVINRLQAESQDRGEGASHSARVKALELLGKHLGLFVDRIKHEGGPVIQTIIGVSAADILGTDAVSPPAE